MKIKIPIPEGFDGDLHVFWYDPSGGNLTDMNAYAVGDYLVFETNHFSYYAVVQLSAYAKTSAVADPTWISQNGIFMLVALLIVLLLMSGVMISRRRKRMA